MIDNMIGTLIAAWILSWFGFDEVVISGMKQFFNVVIDSHGYYFGAAMIGIAAYFMRVSV